MKVKWNGNFQENFFENLGTVYLTRLSSFLELCKFPIFYSALVSSFDPDHSEPDISCTNDGDAHSIKEAL